MSNPLLIRGGTVVTAEGQHLADVLIRDERIAAVGPSLAAEPNATVLDADGCLVMPGLVDAHVHFALNTGIFRTDDDFGIGTRSAACGGVTTVVDFATQLAGMRPIEAVAQRMAEADPLVHIDYALHCMITDFPVYHEPSIADLVRVGVPSIKVYTTYRPNYYCDDAKLVRIMRAAAEASALVMVHAENDSLVSEATQTLVNLGRTGLQYHSLARPALPVPGAGGRGQPVCRPLFDAGHGSPDPQGAAGRTGRHRRDLSPVFTLFRLCLRRLAPGVVYHAATHSGRGASSTVVAGRR
jgi:dihydropyrimidinase